MNNKYLAIVLAVVAVIVVVYQLAFRKEAAPAVRPGMQQAAPAPGNTPPPAPKASQQTQPSSAPTSGIAGFPADTAPEQDIPIIDFNTPLLLERVMQNPIEPYPREELEPEYGAPLFISPPTGSEKEEQIKREIEFKLNSIIIDADRRIAIINNRIVGDGDFVDGAEVALIEKTRVILHFRDKIIELSTDARIKRVSITGGTK